MEYFVQQLINRTREFVIERLEELHFEPPMLEISQDLARSSFFRLFFLSRSPPPSSMAAAAFHFQLVSPALRVTCALRFFLSFDRSLGLQCSQSTMM